MKAPVTLDMPKKEQQEAASAPQAAQVLEEPSVVTTPDLVKDAKDTVVNVTNDTSPCRHLEDPLHATKTPSVECDSPSASDRPWSKLKQAAIVRDNSSVALIPPVTTSSASSNSNHPVSSVEVTIAEPPTSVSESARRTKPALLHLQNRTKHYESVDDLSPEYCGLPFVKKLKILNERQKLAELEFAMKTRSVSLDMPESQQPYDLDTTLTRSHSEASAMHRRNSNTMRLSAGVANQTPTSPESNETPERRNLKSILKKLTEDVRGGPPQQVISPAEAAAGQPTPPQAAESHTRSTTAEMRQLMRAPTVEGYAARHSKLAKSVTFNRDTLQSPPAPGAQPEPPQLAAHAADLTSDAGSNGLDHQHHADDGVHGSGEVLQPQDKSPPPAVQIMPPPPPAGNQIKMIKGK